jgi:hypothetical protein
MAVYESFNSLNGRTLKANDQLIFKDGVGNVQHTYVMFYHSKNNRIVFTAMGLDVEKLASKVYGYGYRPLGSWPTTNGRDFEALTRLALVVFAFEEGAESVKLKMPDGKWVNINRNKFILKNPPPTFDIRVGTYGAKYSGNELHVGCQKIPFKKVEEVYKKMLSLRKTK